jgi:hypothetical protein
MLFAAAESVDGEDAVRTAAQARSSSPPVVISAWPKGFPRSRRRLDEVSFWVARSKTTTKTTPTSPLCSHVGT